MYAAHFGLTERPFSLAPDPRYLYLSDPHREALAHLLYGIGGGGSFLPLPGQGGARENPLCRPPLLQPPPPLLFAPIFKPPPPTVEALPPPCHRLHGAIPR